MSGVIRPERLMAGVPGNDWGRRQRREERVGQMMSSAKRRGIQTVGWILPFAFTLVLSVVVAGAATSSLISITM